jgi:hypothetical protein
VYYASIAFKVSDFKELVTCGLELEWRVKLSWAGLKKEAGETNKSESDKVESDEVREAGDNIREAGDEAYSRVRTL